MLYALRDAVHHVNVVFKAGVAVDDDAVVDRDGAVLEHYGCLFCVREERGCDFDVLGRDGSQIDSD